MITKSDWRYHDATLHCTACAPHSPYPFSMQAAWHCRCTPQHGQAILAPAAATTSQVTFAAAAVVVTQITDSAIVVSIQPSHHAERMAQEHETHPDQTPVVIV